MTPSTYMNLSHEDLVESLRAAALTAADTADGVPNAIRVNTNSQHPAHLRAQQAWQRAISAETGVRDWDREVLTRLTPAPSDRAGFTQPARIVLLAADAESNTAIASKGWGVPADGDRRAQPPRGAGDGGLGGRPAGRAAAHDRSPDSRALHPHVRVMTQPGRDLVRGYRTPSHPRGTFASVKDLNAKIRDFVSGWNDRCHPVVSTKTADVIL